MIGWGGNGETYEWAIFMGSAIFLQADALTCSIKRLHITDKLVMSSVPFAHFIAKPGGRGWDGRIVICRGQVIFERRFFLAQERSVLE